MFIKNMVNKEVTQASCIRQKTYDLRQLRLYGQEEKRKRWMPWQ